MAVIFYFCAKFQRVVKFRLLIKYTGFIVFVFFATNVRSQNAEPDTTRIVEKPAGVEKIHSPKKATIYSAILPGLGQAYNKKYWKIPLIYAGFAGIGYFINWNNNYYQTYKLAYSDLTDGDNSTNSYLDLPASKFYNLDDPTEYSNFKTGLSKQQDYFRRNRDLLIISIFGFYGLNIIDASVDAHFFDFDISEDLSLNWQPTMNTIDNQWVYGFNCKFNF